MTKEFELSKRGNLIYNLLGLLCLLMFFVGIWINAFRWKLIFTSIFFFVFLVINYCSKKYAWEKQQEKKEEDEEENEIIP